MGINSHNYKISVALGYDTGLPHYTIYKAKGSFRALHFYFKASLNDRELQVAKLMMENGYAVIVSLDVLGCIEHIKNFFRGRHKQLKEACVELYSIDQANPLALNERIGEDPPLAVYNETSFHKLIVRRLKEEFPSTPIDGKVTGNINSSFHRVANAIGYSTGLFDIIVWGKKRIILIELKVGNNDLSDSQKKMAERLKEEGGIIGIVLWYDSGRTYERLFDAIREYV